MYLDPWKPVMLPSTFGAVRAQTVCTEWLLRTRLGLFGTCVPTCDLEEFGPNLDSFWFMLYCIPLANSFSERSLLFFMFPPDLLSQFTGPWEVIFPCICPREKFHSPEERTLSYSIITTSCLWTFEHLSFYPWVLKNSEMFLLGEVFSGLNDIKQFPFYLQWRQNSSPISLLMLTSHS